MEKYEKTAKGFTLVELIVSVTITAILMLGLSVFFSSTFHNLFQAQSQAENIQMQFAINEIIRNKFNEMDDLVSINDDSDAIVTLNKNTKNQLPFSYIGKTDIEGKGYLAFKDLMIFNGVLGDVFSNTGTGTITAPANITNLNNPAGFTYLDSKSRYYIAIPSENKIMVCAQGESDCTTKLVLPDIELSMPTDIETDGDDLFISDSGNNRIIKVELGSPNVITLLADNLNFPTGLTYYPPDSLFVSDTFNHQIKRIDISSFPFEIVTVVGDGESKTCDNTAQFCKLNYPTGLVADTNTDSLYISDSGNNRILRMYDPGTPDTLNFSFSPGDNYTLGKIQFLNNDWDAGNYNDSNLIGDSNHYGGKTFDNPKRLTTYVGGDCNSDTNFFHINEDLSDLPPDINPPAINYLEKEDKLIITGNVYTIDDFSLADCDLADPENTINKYKITVEEGNAGLIGNNQIVYFSNRDTVNISFTGVTFENPLINTTGFQTFEITTEDRSKGLVSTNYHVERLGDGYLGTMEDAIEVIADGLNFPTGISLSGTTIYYADSLNNEFKQIPANSTSTLSPIGTTTFSASADSSDFDYISNFIVKNLTFESKNTNKILEMTLDAYTDNAEDSFQTYNINAAFPNH